MVSMPSEPNWPVTFPGNLRWTNASQIVKGMVAYGAAAMAEIDAITRRLRARAGEAELDKAWMEEWSREADRVAKIGDEADAAGNAITAGNQYMRAGNYYYSAERFIPPGDDKLAMYRKALRCYQAAMARLHPDIERVEVPYEGGRDVAGLVRQRPRLGQAADRGAVRRHGQRQGDERDLRRPGFRQARHQHLGDRRARPGRSLAAPQHPRPPRLRGRRHPRLRLCGVTARGRCQARRGDGLQLRRLSRAAHLRLREALCGVRLLRRHAQERLRVRQRPRPDRSAPDHGLDLPVPLGDRRARQRHRAGVGEAIHARRGRPPGHLPGADPARRERPHRAGRAPPRRSTSGSARRTRRCGFSPKPRAAPSTARSTTASSASTSSATGC